MRYKFKNVPPARSKTMKAIARKDTLAEKRLRSALFKDGLRFRIDYKKLPGIPDIVFVKDKVAIFCDGDFWHGKKWSWRKKKLKNNRKYWINKIEGNIKRDKVVHRKLKGLGWSVLRFWESTIHRDTDNVVTKIISAIDSKRKTINEND